METILHPASASLTKADMLAALAKWQVDESEYKDLKPKALLQKFSCMFFLHQRELPNTRARLAKVATTDTGNKGKGKRATVTINLPDTMKIPDLGGVDNNTM